MSFPLSVPSPRPGRIWNADRSFLEETATSRTSAASAHDGTDPPGLEDEKIVRALSRSELALEREG
jgi:hypothetical protein